MRRVAALEGDQGASQHGEVAVEIEVLRQGGVFLEQRVAHPVVADLAASPVAAHQSRETHGFLRHEGADVEAHGLLAFLAAPGRGGAGPLGDDHQAAHVRQSAGDGLDGENFGVPVFYPAVTPILRVADKRGEPVAAMRWASARAVGWLPLS